MYIFNSTFGGNLDEKRKIIIANNFWVANRPNAIIRFSLLLFLQDYIQLVLGLNYITVEYMTPKDC